MLPAIAILICYFYGIICSLAYIGIRNRDLQHAITSVVYLLYIVTPVLYPPEVPIKKGVGIVIYMKPLASLIEFIRHPLSNNFAPIRHNLISKAFVFFLVSFKLILKIKW